MAKYVPLVSPDKKHLVMMKTTVASPGNTDWDSVDGSIMVNRLGHSDQNLIASVWAFASDTKGYFFDVSDAGPTDPDASWTDDSNAFDADTDSFATTNVAGSVSADYLEGQGTNAPATGDTITGDVIFTVTASTLATTSLGIRVTTDGAGEVLLNTSQELFNIEVYFFTLTAPSGGWTYTDLQSLEVRFWQTGAGSTRVFSSSIIVTGSSDIYVATQQDYGRVALHIFDPGTDTWTTRDETAEVAGEYIPTTTENLGIALNVRSDGDAVILFKTADVVDEVEAAIREGGLWSSLTISTGRNGSVVSCGVGSSDEANFIVRANTDNSRTEVVSSSNSRATSFQFDITSHANTYIHGRGCAISGGQAYAPYVDSDGTIRVYDWTSSPTPALGTTTQATTNLIDTSTDSQLKLGLVLDGTDRHLFYIRDTDDDIYHKKDDGSWGGSSTNEISGTGAIGALSANKLTTDIGIIYDDAGTAKFAVYELAGAVTSIAFKPFNYNNFLVR